MIRNSLQNVYVFSDSVLCLGGNVKNILRQQELGKTIASRTSVVTMQSVSQSSIKTSKQDNGHFVVLEMKKFDTEDSKTNVMENGTL